MVLGSCPAAVTSPSDFAPALSKEFLDIQATIDCGFTLKRVCDMTRTYSQCKFIDAKPMKTHLHLRQPSSCSGNMQHLYRRIPMPKYEFLCNFVKIRYPHGYSSVNLLHIFRTLFPKYTSGGRPITHTWQSPKHTSALKKINFSWKNYKISTSSLGWSLVSLICFANRWTGFYMIGTSVIKELKRLSGYELDNKSSLKWYLWLRKKQSPRGVM